MLSNFWYTCEVGKMAVADIVWSRRAPGGVINSMRSDLHEKSAAGMLIFMHQGTPCAAVQIRNYPHYTTPRTEC